MIKLLTMSDYKLNGIPAPEMKNVIVQAYDKKTTTTNIQITIGFLYFDKFPLVAGMNIEFSGMDITILKKVTIRGQVLSLKPTFKRDVYERITIMGYVVGVDK